jgi:uncharacterized protein (TIGR02145 family)
MDATHRCHARTTGAQNWEAWIKDSRDNELYRIVFMPDNKWWLAQNVKYAATGAVISGCNKDECGRTYSYAQAYGSWGGTSGFPGNVQGVCPNGWVLPITANWNTFMSSISSNENTIAERLRSYDSPCSPKTDYYGWASIIGTWPTYLGKDRGDTGEGWYSNTAGDSKHITFHIDIYNCCVKACGRASTIWTGAGTYPGEVRCFRQL